MLQILLSLLILTLPLNLFLKFYIEQAYVNGLLIDYLIPKIFLSDLVLYLLLFAWLAAAAMRDGFRCQILLDKIKKHRGLLILAVLLFIRQFFSLKPISGLWFSLQLIEMGLLTAFLWNQRKLLHSQLTRLSLAAAFVFQTLLAAYQFFVQQPLLPYKFLGEPSFRPYLQLHRQTILGQEKILAYASTAHPNVLAGLGVMFFLILWPQADRSGRFKILKQFEAGVCRKTIKGILLILVLAVLFFTQSISGLLTLILGLAFQLKKSSIGEQKSKAENKNISSFFSRLNSLKLQRLTLVLIIFLTPLVIAAGTFIDQRPSLMRRTILNQAAVKIWIKQPILGSGLNQMTAALEKVIPYQKLRGFVQPVHHVPFLWLAEAGILGVVIVILIWRKISTALKPSLIRALVVISPLLVLDHYLYTLQTGRLLLVLWIIHSLQKNSLP